MGLTRACVAGLISLWLGVAAAQDITSDEMLMLDKLRAQFKSKGVEVTPEQEARMLQRIRALRARSPSDAAPGLAQPLRPPRPNAAPAQPATTAPAVGASLDEADLQARLARSSSRART